MNFNTFDLNLVRVFLALWEQRSVTAAAHRLNLTQPAVSHALKRLREQFSDPLFTRVGKTMEPTEMAQRLHAPFTQCVSLLRETMSTYGSFDPATSQRVFTVAMSDISETYVLPQIIAPLMLEAPGVRLRSVQLEADGIDVKLRSGQVDMAVGYLPDLKGDEFESTFLLEDWFLCIMRKDHPLADEPLSREHLDQIEFIEVTVHATGFQMMRSILQHMEIKRRIRAQIEHFSVIPEIVRHSDLVAIYPSSVASRLVESGQFIAKELPFVAPSIDIHAHYHNSFGSDPGLKWLRGLLIEALSVPEAGHPAR